MYTVLKSYANGEGEQIYNASSIVGIFDNYSDAKNELIEKLNKLNYTYEMEDS